MNQPGYSLFLVNGQKVAVTKVDDLTVQMVTPEPFAPFLDIFGGGLILPEHAFGPFVRNHQFLQAYSVKSRPEKIVGAGPFRIKKIQAGDYVLLERNPEYWAVDKAKHRLPYFEELMILATPANAPAAALGTLFLSGGSDVFERARPQDYPQFKEASKGGKVNIAELGIGTERDFLWFNLNTNRNIAGQPIVAPNKLSWFQKKQFRQAISCAIDRERIVREVYGGRAKPIHTFFTEEDKKWNNADVPLFIYDPSRARTLLGEIGIKDRDGDGVMEDESGTKIEFSFFSNTGNPTRERSAALIAEDLAKVGLKADLKLVYYMDLVERINRGFNYDCILMGLGPGIPDPASQIFVLKSSGQLHQWFPNQPTPATDWEVRIDVLMEGQMRTLDFGTRKKLFDEVQLILAEQMPMIYTVAPFHFAAARVDVGNLRPSVLASYRMTWNVEELYFKTNAPAAHQ
jgi:peptide/nickel transport system substrate-binding protein